MLRNFLFFCSVALLSVFSTNASATIQLDAPIGVLIDGESGAVIFEKNSRTAVNPGDLTCLMTLYTALKLSTASKSNLKDPVDIHYQDTQVSQSSRRIYLVSGMKVPLETLLRAVSILGAEDAALAIARFLCGSYEAFGEKMNFYAQQLGMKDSFFSSPISSENQKTSALDLALVSNQIRTEFPNAFSWFSETEFSFSGHTQKNGNLSLWKSSSINGVMASASNLNIISSWLRVENGKATPRSLISVILQGKNREKTIDESFNLLRQGWINYETIKLFEDNATIARLDVLKGNRDKLDVGFSKAVWVTVPHKLLVTRGTGGFSTHVVYMHPIVAPIKQGTRIGTLQVNFEQKMIATFPLYARHDIGKGSFISRLIDSVRLRTEKKYTPSK